MALVNIIIIHRPTDILNLDLRFDPSTTELSCRLLLELTSYSILMRNLGHVALAQGHALILQVRESIHDWENIARRFVPSRLSLISTLSCYRSCNQ